MGAELCDLSALFLASLTFHGTSLGRLFLSSAGEVGVDLTGETEVIRTGE